MEDQVKEEDTLDVPSEVPDEESGEEPAGEVPPDTFSPITSSEVPSESTDICTVVHPTSSVYRGALMHGRMEGKGEFTFPTGTKYVGNFKDGFFHGHGTLYFPHGGEFEAEWEDGNAVGDGSGGQYTFEGGLLHKECDWEYCNMADRRFYSEICCGIKPAGRTQLTNNTPPPTIPLGWFDCGDGLYNPKNRVVYTYHTNKFLRNADTDEHDWIVKTCRKGVTEEEQLSAKTGLFA